MENNEVRSSGWSGSAAVDCGGSGGGVFPLLFSGDLCNASATRLWFFMGTTISAPHLLQRAFRPASLSGRSNGWPQSWHAKMIGIVVHRIDKAAGEGACCDLREIKKAGNEGASTPPKPHGRRPGGSKAHVSQDSVSIAAYSNRSLSATVSRFFVVHPSAECSGVVPSTVALRQEAILI